jgi:hypothetical protein
MRGSWRLITPGRNYRPPVTGDEPGAAELRALAERDLAAGHTVKDWTDAERERWLLGLRKSRFFARHYNPIRHPEPPLAPPRWRDELVLIAALTALTVLSEQRAETLAWAIALMPAWHVLDEADKHARRRSAARLGLTWETAPIHCSPSGGLFYFVASLGPWTWRKLRGQPDESWRMSWSFYLAMRIVSAVSERRSWRAASISAPPPPGAVDLA